MLRRARDALTERCAGWDPYSRLINLEYCIQLGVAHSRSSMDLDGASFPELDRAKVSLTIRREECLRRPEAIRDASLDSSPARSAAAGSFVLPPTAFVSIPGRRRG
jgi:hypothetical protein